MYGMPVLKQVKERVTTVGAAVGAVVGEEVGAAVGAAVATDVTVHVVEYPAHDDVDVWPALLTHEPAMSEQWPAQSWYQARS